MGRHFVEACFPSEELTPSAVGFCEWAKGRVHIVCNEMGKSSCSAFIRQLSEEGHREAVRVLNSTAVRGHSTRPIVAGSVMVVLLTESPQSLTQEWAQVEKTIHRRPLTLVVTTDATVALPAVMSEFARIDASLGHASQAVKEVLVRFEEQGFRNF
jgi:hypothetical protein